MLVCWPYNDIPAKLTLKMAFQSSEPLRIHNSKPKFLSATADGPMKTREPKIPNSTGNRSNNSPSLIGFWWIDRMPWPPSPQNNNTPPFGSW